MSEPWHLPAQDWAHARDSPGHHRILEVYRHSWHLEAHCLPGETVWHCTAVAEGITPLEDTITAAFDDPEPAVQRCYAMADARMET